VSAVFDEGLQLERTALAWRRTAAAILVGSLIAVRVVPSVFGLWSIALGVGGLMLGAVLLIRIDRRYRRLDRLLRTEGDAAAVQDGVAIALVSICLVAAAGTMIALVLHHATVVR
jgi:uncharacterized membrane protein YidH (DUF202 family)